MNATHTHARTEAEIEADYADAERAAFGALQRDDFGGVLRSYLAAVPAVEAWLLAHDSPGPRMLARNFVSRRFIERLREIQGYPDTIDASRACATFDVPAAGLDGILRTACLRARYLDAEGRGESFALVVEDLATFAPVVARTVPADALASHPVMVLLVWHLARLQDEALTDR